MFANAIGIILYADESHYEYESLAITIVRSVPLWRCLSPHLFVWLALSALIATTTYSTSPPPRNARWYRWYHRHRRCHSPSLFLAFVQRNKPIMPGLSGAGGSWGWVSLFNWFADGTSYRYEWVTTWLHSLPLSGYSLWSGHPHSCCPSSSSSSSSGACVWSASRVPCPSESKNDLIMNSSTRNCCSLDTQHCWQPNCLLFFHIFPFFPLPPFKRICTVKNQQQFHMQKTHKHTGTHTHTCTVTMALEFEKLLSRLMSVKKATGTTSGLVGFGPLLPMDQPIWKSKCRRRIMRL